MTVRAIVLFVGAVALIVGVVGLLAPVSVGEQKMIGCGTPVMSDLSEARAVDDGNDANIPIMDEVVVDTDYVRLCRMELADRRAWTITLAAVGALAIVGALAMGKRHKARSSP